MSEVNRSSLPPQYQVLNQSGRIVAKSGGGVKPQRVIWPAEGKFLCADYFRPQERLTDEQIQELVHFFEETRPQVCVLSQVLPSRALLCLFSPD